MANVAKSKKITCHTGEIQSGISEKTFGQRSTGKGDTYREHLQRRLPCPDWGVEFTS